MSAAGRCPDEARHSQLLDPDGGSIAARSASNRTILSTMITSPTAFQVIAASTDAGDDETAVLRAYMASRARNLGCNVLSRE